MFTIESLQKQIAAGEDSTRQFKVDVRNLGFLGLRDGGLCQF